MHESPPCSAPSSWRGGLVAWTRRTANSVFGGGVRVGCGRRVTICHDTRAALVCRFRSLSTTCRVSRLLPITRALSVGSLTDGALISNRSGPTDDTTDSDKREQRWKTKSPMVTTRYLWEPHKPPQFGTN